MSTEAGITRVQGEGWRVTYDGRAAPEYVIVTVRGMASRTRTEQLLAMIAADRPRNELPTGELCPIIVLSHENPPPSAAVLRSEYDLLDEVIPQVSCLLLVLELAQLRESKVQLALEATGVSIAPNIVVVSSLAEALEKVESYHAQRRAR